MKLTEYLKAAGLSLTDFAREAGLTVPTAHRVATGKVLPSRATMQRIFNATGGVVTPNDFFGMRGAHDAPPAATRQTEV